VSALTTQNLISVESNSMMTSNESHNSKDLKQSDMGKSIEFNSKDWVAVSSSTSTLKSEAVNLRHTFEHSSVVCCVNYSKDGNYIATGCNRKAFVFNAETGEQLQ
jgi:general transcriptional corepressor TUP1